ncbi:MAG: PstA family ABC transporter permease, partial [Planctomycetota bacterium]
MRRHLARSGTAFSWAASLGVLAGAATLVGFLLVRGGETLGPRLLFGEVPWHEAIFGGRPVFEGIWPALAGSLALVGIASCVAIVVGIAAGIHVSEYASKGWRTTVGIAVDLLAGVPSVVMGLFGFTLILFLRRTLLPGATTSLLLASFCIALLVLPYLIRATQNSLQAVPEHVRLIGPSLGLSRWQNLRHILLPAASRGILSGAILAIGRAAEDTAVIMLTGAVMNCGLPQGLTEKFEALPYRIYVIAAEHRDADELAQGFGC